MRNKIEVVAAIMYDEQDRFFCAKRKNEGELAKKWEFPGGKIEPGESAKEALTREIEEELQTNIYNVSFFMTVQHDYLGFSLTMYGYFAQIDKKDITLTEHLDAKWVPRSALLTCEWAPADLPIVHALMKVDDDK